MIHMMLDFLCQVIKIMNQSTIGNKFIRLTGSNLNVATQEIICSLNDVPYQASSNQNYTSVKVALKYNRRKKIGLLCA